MTENEQVKRIPRVPGRLNQGSTIPYQRNSETSVIHGQAWNLVSNRMENPHHPANNLYPSSPLPTTPQKMMPVSPPPPEDKNSISILDFLKQDIWDPLVGYLTEDGRSFRESVTFF